MALYKKVRAVAGVDAIEVRAGKTHAKTPRIMCQIAWDAACFPLLSGDPEGGTRRVATCLTSAGPTLS